MLRGWISSEYKEHNGEILIEGNYKFHKKTKSCAEKRISDN